MINKIRKTVARTSLFGLLGTFLTVVLSFDYIYSEYFAQTSGNEPIIWAGTIALGVTSFFGLLNYCVYAQSIVKDEIERVTLQKSKLEEQVLRKRISSNVRRRSK